MKTLSNSAFLSLMSDALNIASPHDAAAALLEIWINHDLTDDQVKVLEDEKNELFR